MNELFVYKFRDSIEYRCVLGHRYIRGDLVRQCRLDSNWTGVVLEMQYLKYCKILLKCKQKIYTSRDI